MSDKSCDAVTHAPSLTAKRRTAEQRLAQIAETLELDVSFFYLQYDKRWNLEPSLARTLSFVGSEEGRKFVAFLMRIKDAELRQEAVELILSSAKVEKDAGGRGGR